jgi:23S rRNA (guanine745-N1)-methyltransferase
MKKIEAAQQFLQHHLALFRCPVCQQPYEAVEGFSLVCPIGHRLDLNRKGTLYFLQHQIKSEYDADMLSSRRRILQAGLFDPFVQAIQQQLAPDATILDVGCGEGTSLQQLATATNTAVGFDISPAGVNLATQPQTPAFFCVADLARLPFNDHSFTTVLNLFSPSNYAEFQRVLKPGGQLFKIIPNADYLAELRAALYANDPRKSSYSNEQVLTHFQHYYPQAQTTRFRYQLPLTSALARDLLYMTPLHWQAPEERVKAYLAAPLTAITVDVTLLQN